MSEFLTLDNLAVQNKIVLLRADLNVPMKDGKVTDHERLERLLPTLKDLKKARARIVVLSHLGRPDGRVDTKYSLRPVAAELASLWGEPIAFAEDCIGPKAQQAVANLKPGQILVLENTRFHVGEETNDPVFIKALASLGEVYVNDAFSCAHRAHASTEGLAGLLPSGAGRLMQAELDALATALGNPERPVAALVGGSKISTKLDLLNNLITKVDILVLGGGMANTFLAAKGFAIGKSLYEANMVETARGIMARAVAEKCQIVLPSDVVIAPALRSDVRVQTVAIDAIPSEEMILDLGPHSIREIVHCLTQCKTCVWNGPLGAFETKPFDQATNEIARVVATLTQDRKILSVAGGGDTVSALSNAGVNHKFSYLSAAGGAFLEWMEGKHLPGVIALRRSVRLINTEKAAV